MRLHQFLSYEEFWAINIALIEQANALNALKGRLNAIPVSESGPVLHYLNTEVETLDRARQKFFKQWIQEENHL